MLPLPPAAPSSRRAAGLVAAALLLLPAPDPVPPLPDAAGAFTPGAEPLAAQGVEAGTDDLAALRAEIERYETHLDGGRLGVGILHLESGRSLFYRGDERFPMASTYKVPIATRLLERVDRGEISLDSMIAVQRGDLHPGSGVLEDLFDDPGVILSVRNLMELMLLISDNSATDICMRLAGGPEAIDRTMRELGVRDLRVDRPTVELIADYVGVENLPPADEVTPEVWKELSESVPEERREKAREAFSRDPRDTSTPRAMAELLERIWRGEALSDSSTAVLKDVLRRVQTGTARLRGMLDDSITVAHKTGTVGPTLNDVGVLELPDGGGHVVTAVFTKQSDLDRDERAEVVAHVARAAYDYFRFNPAVSGGQGAAAEPDAAGDDRASAPAPPYDVLIRGGTVVDGTGSERFRADVAVSSDAVARVARGGLGGTPADSARTVLDASGLIVAPGFMDNHAHVEKSFDDRPLAENFLRQGITTVLASLHSRDQPYPLAAYTDSLSRQGLAPNIGFFAGHTWIRKRVIGYADRAPTDAELEEMRGLVREAMEDGALGLSTGLQYIPANYAETEEVIALAEVASEHGGIYSSHMRNEARGLLSSVRELIRIADEADIPAQIQHHKAFGPGQWGWSEKSLALIDSARAEGLDVKHDLYPYTAASTGWNVLFPEWALAGGTDSLLARLDDPATRKEIRAEMREEWRAVWTGDDLCRIQFRTVDALPEYDGRRLCDLARDRGMPNEVDAGITLVMDLARKGGFSAIYHAMSEEDVRRIMSHEWAMFETDGDAVAFGRGFPHPRSYGAFPRILRKYVREEDVLGLEEAIEKMTSMPADQIGQARRGRIEEGAYADVTVFDPDRVGDRATFTEPHRYSVGIVHVLVNGVPVIEDASLTGEKPGRVLTGPARPKAVTAGR